MYRTSMSIISEKVDITGSCSLLLKRAKMMTTSAGKILMGEESESFQMIAVTETNKLDSVTIVAGVVIMGLPLSAGRVAVQDGAMVESHAGSMLIYTAKGVVAPSLVGVAVVTVREGIGMMAALAAEMSECTLNIPTQSELAKSLDVVLVGRKRQGSVTNDAVQIIMALDQFVGVLVRLDGRIVVQVALLMPAVVPRRSEI